MYRRHNFAVRGKIMPVCVEPRASMPVLKFTFRWCRGAAMPLHAKHKPKKPCVSSNCNPGSKGQRPLFMRKP